MPTRTPTATTSPTPTITPTPTSLLFINVYTDKTRYSEGEVMHFGLDLGNHGPAQSVRFLIFLWTPWRLIPLTDLNLDLSTGFSYSNSDFLKWTLPAMPPGSYAWIGALIPTDRGPIVDFAMWTFVSGVSSQDVVPVEEILKGLQEVSLGFGEPASGPLPAVIPTPQRLWLPAILHE
jgi:hypothetical protein